MFRINWKVPFTTINGKAAVVNIYRETSTEPVVKRLQASAVPFETEEENDEDVMQPVRGQTGYLRLLDYAGETEELAPTDNMQHYMELVVDGEVMWCGYIQAANYSSPWEASPRAVELPVASGLAVLESVSMEEQDNMGLVSFAALLVEAIQKSGVLYEKIYYPEEFKVEDSSAYYSPFQCEVSRVTFYSETDGNRTNENGHIIRYEGKDYRTMLEMFCKFWGWSLHERGKELHFVSSNSSNYGCMTFAQLQQLAIKADATPTSEQPAEIDMKALMLDGDSNTRDVLQGKRRVKITQNVDLVKTLLPSAASAKVKVIGSSVQIAARQFYALRVLAPLEWNYKCRLFEIDSTNTIREHSAPLVYGINKFEGSSASASWESMIGSQIIEIDEGEGPIDRETKINLDFQRVVRLQTEQTTLDGVTKILGPSTSVGIKKLFSMYSKKVAMYESGALEVKMNVGLVLARGRRYAATDSKVPDISAASVELVLRIGNKWWSGASWVSSETSFKARIKKQTDNFEQFHHILSNKTLEQVEYNGATGLIIPITETLSGEVELSVCQGTSFSTTFRYNTASEVQLEYTDYTKQYQLKDFEINYIVENGINNIDDSDRSKNEYTAEAGKFREEYEVELNINTDSGNGAAYSGLTLNGAAVANVKSSAYGKIKPENSLLKTLQRLFATQTEKLNIEYEMASIRPFDIVKREGKKYRMISAIINWIDEAAKYTFISYKESGVVEPGEEPENPEPSEPDNPDVPDVPEEPEMNEVTITVIIRQDKTGEQYVRIVSSKSVNVTLFLQWKQSGVMNSEEVAFDGDKTIYTGSDAEISDYDVLVIKEDGDNNNYIIVER